MSAVAAVPEPSRETIAEIVAALYNPQLSTRDNAIKAYKTAEDSINEDVALQGWQDLFRQHESTLWVRSGHHNKSGWGNKVRTLPGRGVLGILDRRVLFNDGASVRLGNMTKDLCVKASEEYAAREKSNAAGRVFFELLATACGSKTVEKLGAEKVESLRQKASFRV